MAERKDRFVTYTADDEMPDCMCCDHFDSVFDNCSSCGSEYGWFGYRRTEMVGDTE